MGYKKFENEICSAFEEIVPENTFEKITAEISASDERTKILMTRKKRNIAKILIPVAACFAVCIGIFGGVIHNVNAVASVISIDVNPSVEITANKNDKVLSVTAVNDDAKAVIGENDYTGVELSEVVDELITSMADGGYMDKENNGILVTVQNDDDEKAAELGKELVSDIDKALEKNNKTAGVINQISSYKEDIRKFAVDNYLSYGKAVFIMNIASKDSSIDPVKLATMSVADILETAAEKNIDIRDFCNISADDPVNSIFEKIISIEDGILAEKEHVSNNVVISETDAELAALTHAGLKASDVEGLTVELYRENAGSLYFVEFTYEGTLYAFEIDCETGDIIICGTDYSPEPEMEIEQPIIG